MAKIKLTKNELKRQKDALKRFERYLPTLMLKKQQLQLVIRQVEAEIRKKIQQREELLDGLQAWIRVFGEDVPIDNILKVGSISTSVGNIAGVDIPVFDDISFAVSPYNLITLPLWVDRGIEVLREAIALDAEIHVLNRQLDRLRYELRITTQRVNLFEKIKIPETKENIRRIRIVLGDEQTASVVRGKIAKRNLVRES
ncbi:MAG: V-type ATP synthase subunit D [Spirochaetales bacterium]|nr:V-type ATP synthase subunit D [Spirochaetales bacterium]